MSIINIKMKFNKNSNPFIKVNLYKNSNSTNQNMRALNKLFNKKQIKKY